MQTIGRKEHKGRKEDHGLRDHETTAAGKGNDFSMAGDFEFLWSDLVGFSRIFPDKWAGEADG